MANFLGYCRVSLGEDDCNLLLARFGVEGIAFRSGCFTISRKVAMGLGATLVAVPTSAPGFLIFNVPFDQIKGDRTGGFASTIANLGWGFIRDAIQKNLTRTIAGWGMSPQAVAVDQVQEPRGGKVGRVIFQLDHLNHWLSFRPVAPGITVAVHEVAGSERSLDLTLAVWGR